MPDIQEINGSNSDLSRSRSKSLVDSACLLRGHDRQKYNRRYSTEDWRGNYSEIQDGNRISGDSGRGNYAEIPPESPRTPTSQSANVSKLSSAAPGDITSASSKDSGNYSYREQSSMLDSPGSSHGNHGHRNSPSMTVQHVQEMNMSRSSPCDYSDQMRKFNRYDNTFREPTTVDIPTKYDDIAMFKNSEPADQVSSSTDSGYEHGHNFFDRLTDAQRLSGMRFNLSLSIPYCKT